MCPTRWISGRGTSSGLSVPAPAAARSWTTSVISSEYGWAAWTRACARTMREAAMSSIARVIFFVDCTVRIRRRRIRSWPPAIPRLRLLARRAGSAGGLAGQELLLGLLHGLAHAVAVGHGAGRADAV